MPLSKNQLKLIVSLQQKKYRFKNRLFVVEGIKVVNEFLNSKYELDRLFCLQDVYYKYESYEPELINEQDLKKMSSLKSPNQVLALFKIPEKHFEAQQDLIVVLDGINDPGNLGTIIRLCDWFGVKQLVCSRDTVDCYNSKVVQSTMGSLTRVEVVYTSLSDFLEETNYPVFVTDMIGDSLYSSELPQKAIVVMGNEANGVTNEVKQLVDKKITIPRFGDMQATESLNVATATAIVLNEFRRATQIKG